MALSLLFVSAVTHAARDKLALLPLLEGDHLSPAGTLGKLLNKGIRSWLHDIFGSDSQGRPLLAKMILLSNARGRRQGPVTATLRSAYLSPKAISIFVDGEDISNDCAALETLYKNILRDFSQRKDSRLKGVKRKAANEAIACAA